MTPLSPTRRAAEEFASLVDGSRTEADARYADLLTCIDVLREQETPAPRADFVADLRMRLMDAADTLLVPAEGPLAPVIPLVAPVNRRQRRISIAAAALVVVGGGAGVAAAADSALPGDPLYPIKRGIESAQVSLNSSDSGKGQDLLRQASVRLDEVDGLIADKGSVDKINATLTAFQRSAAGGADLLFVSYQRGGDAQDITRLRTMLGSQITHLDALADEAPENSESSFASARSLLNDLDQQASVLCSTCGPTGPDGAVAMAAAATSLSSLLSPADTAARAEREAAADRRLAAAADRIAKNVRPPEKPTPTPTSTASPSVPVSSDPNLPLPSSGDPLGDVVKGVTGGLAGLLGADSALGDTLDTTLDSLTEGLLP